MCPLCTRCPYWNLSDTCFQAQTSVIFDNSATVFFAAFMALWGKQYFFSPLSESLLISPNCLFRFVFLKAVCFLEYWKRKNITLAYQWNCLDYEQEDVRFKNILKSGKDFF